MLETSKVYGAAFMGLWLASCATPEVTTPVSPPVVTAPAPAPKIDEAALGEEARAFLAQAETDIQRARSKRALWSKAWESLVLARQASVAKDNGATRAHARRASELAQLGLEQLAYPAVK